MGVPLNVRKNFRAGISQSWIQSCEARTRCVQATTLAHRLLWAFHTIGSSLINESGDLYLKLYGPRVPKLPFLRDFLRWRHRIVSFALRSNNGLQLAVPAYLAVGIHRYGMETIRRLIQLKSDLQPCGILLSMSRKAFPSGSSSFACSIRCANPPAGLAIENDTYFDGVVDFDHMTELKSNFT